MAIFKYTAIQEGGAKVVSFLPAENIKEAKLFLLKQGIVALKIVPLKRIQSKLKKEDILNFSDQLAKLLKAGFPLYDSLLILEGKYRGHRPHLFILNLLDKIKNGYSFSYALSEYFEPLFISIIKQSERTASLAQGLDEIAALLYKKMQLKKKIISSFLYPAILFSFCIFVLGGLLFFVIPSLFDLFEGRELHPLTSCILAVSRAVYDKKLIILLFFITFVGLLFFLFKKKRDLFLTLFFKIPYARSFILKFNLAYFCKSFSSLLKGGVPHVTAISLAKGGINYPPLYNVLKEAEEKLVEGNSLSDLLRDKKVIPPLVFHMLAVAEKGGQVATMLDHIARIYEDEVEKSLSKISTIVQPLILVILGILVGFIVIAVLLPLTDVSSFTGGKI